MEEAIEAVKSGELSTKKAAEKYGVARATLQRRINGTHTKQHGGQAKFSQEEEKSIADVLLSCTRLGVPLTRTLLIKTVLSLGKAKGWSLENSKFSNAWHKRFLKQHPELAVRVISTGRRKKPNEFTPEICANWISKMSGLFNEGYLSDPNGVWLLDEKVFQLTEIFKRVCAARVCPETQLVGDGRERMTVLAGGNAAGVTLRPFMLYDGKVQLASHFTEVDQEDSLRGSDKSRWMDNPNCAAFIKTELLPNMTAEKNIIFVSGDSSLINNLDFFMECLNSGKDIQVMCAPSGKGAKIGLLDKSMFGGFKYNWRQHLQEMHSGCFDVLPPLSRDSFPLYVATLCDTLHVDHALKAGLAKVGIFPYRPDIIQVMVKPSANAPAVVVPDEFAPQKRKIRQILTKELNLTKPGIKAVMEQIDRAVKEVPRSVTA